MNSVLSPFLFLALLISTPSYGAACGAAGSLNVNKSANGGAFIFFPSRSYGDSRFVLPGKDFSKDSSAPLGKVRFFIDGIHYQFLTTPKSQFIVEGEPADDATVLARHAAWEREYIAKVGNPHKEIQEIGSRQRPALDETPALHFKLWRLKISTKKSSVRQYFLTTVIGDDVAMLSAIIEEEKYEAQAMSALDSFAQTFKFLLAEEPCPPASSIDL